MIPLSYLYKIRVVAADKKIGGLVPAGFAAAIWCSWWCFAGALPVHTDAVFAAVFGAVYSAYSFSLSKS